MKHVSLKCDDSSDWMPVAGVCREPGGAGGGGLGESERLMAWIP